MFLLNTSDLIRLNPRNKFYIYKQLIKNMKLKEKEVIAITLIIILLSLFSFYVINPSLSGQPTRSLVKEEHEIEIIEKPLRETEKICVNKRFPYMSKDTTICFYYKTQRIDEEIHKKQIIFLEEINNAIK